MAKSNKSMKGKKYGPNRVPNMGSIKAYNDAAKDTAAGRVTVKPKSMKTMRSGRKK